LRDYFAARTASAAPTSAFVCGFGYRHFKECVNAGLYAQAEESRARLAGIYRHRFGTDFGLGSEIPDLEPDRPIPFNLTGAFFFSGILELNGLGRPGRAAAHFAASVAAARRLQGHQNPYGLRDGETADLAAQSRRHLPMALAATEPDRAVVEIEALEGHMIGEDLPAALVTAARAQTFIRLVNAGSYAAAERLAPRISRQPEDSSAEALDALYCLAMLALQQGRPGEAAELFARVQQMAGGRTDLLESARFHEELSLRS
jgi:hypothetical protein